MGGRRRTPLASETCEIFLRAFNAAASVLAAPFTSTANHTSQTTTPTTPAATFCTTFAFCSDQSGSAFALSAWISALIIAQSLWVSCGWTVATG